MSSIPSRSCASRRASSARAGLLAFNMPNYRWIYEGHYNTPWIPAMSKPASLRRYVSLLGRDPAYVDTLNFLSPRIDQADAREGA